MFFGKENNKDCVNGRRKWGISMNYTGYVRQIDSVGRLVLPMDIRVKLDLQNKAFVEFFIDGDAIVLRKYHPACIFCDNAEDLTQFGGKSICKKCAEKIASGEGSEG